MMVQEKKSFHTWNSCVKAQIYGLARKALKQRLKQWYKGLGFVWFLFSDLLFVWFLCQSLGQEDILHDVDKHLLEETNQKTQTPSSLTKSFLFS